MDRARGTIQNDDTANLVISQVYPGGGLTGASFTNDFIELFNRGTTTVDFSVTPYSLQFLSTSGSIWAKTDLTSGTLAPGRYFLIKESGGAVGAALPTPGATGPAHGAILPERSRWYSEQRRSQPRLAPAMTASNPSTRTTPR